MMQECQLGPTMDSTHVSLCSHDNSCETENPRNAKRQQSEYDTSNAAHTEKKDSKTAPCDDRNYGRNFLSTLFAMLEASHGEANYLPDALLETPLRTNEIFKAILDSEEKGYIKNLYTKIYLELYSFKMIRLRYGRKKHRVEKAKNYDKTSLSLTSSAADTVIVAFDDFRQENELVYSITVNHHENYVVLAFRGSATLEDWIADLNPAMKVLENPILDLRGQIPEIQLHAGFYDYLHRRQLSTLPARKTYEPTIPSSLPQLFTTSNGVLRVENEKEAPTKCEVIIEKLSSVFRDYPEYSLFITGHSLGGALATLFAFEAACLQRREIPTLITCINFASPKVGNSHFSRAIDYLEETGVLRHVRVTNQSDPVPRLPVRAYVNDCCLLCRMKNMYMHVGFKVELKLRNRIRVKHAPKFESFQRDYFIFSFKRVARMCFNVAHFLVAGNVEALRYHSCLDYYELIRETKEQLLKIDLDELYDGIRGT